MRGGGGRCARSGGCEHSYPRKNKEVKRNFLPVSQKQYSPQNRMALVCLFHDRRCAHQCQVPIVSAGLRKCSCEEDGAILIAGASLADEEDDVLPTLQGGSDAVEVGLGVYGLLINLKNNIATGETDVIGK